MKVVWIAVALAVTAGAGWKISQAGDARAEGLPASALYQVRRGSLQVVVKENGYLKAKNSVRLNPLFRNQGTITWLIEEGDEVQEGDKLIEFDKTDLTNQISELETSLIQYEIELEAATADLQIQERDNQAGIEKAELAEEIAKLELERYEMGEAPNARRKLDLAREKAESEFDRATERFAQVPELQAEGFLTKIQAEEERIRLREAEINQENAGRELELHDKYEHPMKMTQLRTGVADAKRELMNASAKAQISLKQKQAKETQQQRQVKTAEDRLAQLREELDKMTLRATQAGIVHYGDPNRRWMRDQIKVGNTIHKGNTAITLPDLRVMQVLVSVHEADVDQVEVGMPVQISIETHKGKVFPGKVTEVANVAESSGWDEDANRSFRVEITMEESEVSLRAGVTAKAEIQVERLEDVLYVPIHAAIPENGGHVCFVLEGGAVQRREVQVGRHNAHFLAIDSGLQEGDEIVLYDPREGGAAGGVEGSGAGLAEEASPGLSGDAEADA